jgi:beta-galactosidase GanA
MMKIIRYNSFPPRFIIFIFFILNQVNAVFAQDKTDKNIPRLQKQGTAIQLLVDGKPYLMLAGELGNSSTSNLAYMRPLWAKLVKMNLNTVLVPVYWEMIEPVEDKFDFSLVDTMIKDSKKNNLHLVLLWFGSWKNSMSCYTPSWLKTNSQRFFRAQDKAGRSLEILTPFSEENRDADCKTFAALMKHIKQTDKTHQVIMVQVENEIGMLPDARDHSQLADAYYTKAVPKELIEYFQKNKDKLLPETSKAWESKGFKTSGAWEDIFGKSLATDELFMAWYFAIYANKVAEAGKTEYPIPMYVNAALNRPGTKPGEYPSAGPLPHLLDIWKAAAPSIDIFSPDIYHGNFQEWCQKYQKIGNPVFIPEIGKGDQNAAQVFYVFGQHDAMGFSPFSIESTDSPEKEPLAKSYNLLSQLSQLILEKQGKGDIDGSVVDKDNPVQNIKAGNYLVHVSHEYTLGWSPKSKEQTWPLSACIIISTGEDEFIVAGTGVVITFEPNSPGDPIAGIVSIDEGNFVNGKWIAGRRLNGDHSNQGRHLRIPVGDWGIQKVKLYRYK